jgi:hypothetical protein
MILRRWVRYKELSGFQWRAHSTLSLPNKDINRPSFPNALQLVSLSWRTLCKILRTLTLIHPANSLNSMQLQCLSDLKFRGTTKIGWDYYNFLILNSSVLTRRKEESTESFSCNTENYLNIDMRYMKDMHEYTLNTEYFWRKYTSDLGLLRL